MANAKLYKGTGTPPSTITDGNVYFDLTNKKILVDHKTNRYTLLCTDTVPNVPTKTSQLTNDSGFITNAGVTGVKGSSESSYRTGNVNITYANVGAAAASHTHSRSQLTDAPGLYGKQLWVTANENATYIKDTSTSFSVTDSNIANKYPIYLAMRFFTSSTDSSWFGPWLIFPMGTSDGSAHSQGWYLNTGNIGFTTGCYYYGRRAAASSDMDNQLAWTPTSTGGNGRFLLAQGYRNNDANAKWCTPAEILGVWVLS